MRQEPQVLMSGLRLCESPRWHDGRLWFADWPSRELIALDLEGNHEVIANLPTHPFCMDWLLDGRMVVTAGTAPPRRAAGPTGKHRSGHR